LPFISSAMPSLSSTSITCTPLMPPLAGSVISTVLAASSVRFSASGVLTSGRGPSEGTASPKLTRISATAVPG
jgi:hypothetical protein